MGIYVLQDGSWQSANIHVLSDNAWQSANGYVLQDGSWQSATDGTSGGDGGDGGSGGDGGGGSGTGVTVELSPDESSKSVTPRQGLEIRAEADLDGISVRISENASGYTRALLWNVSDGTEAAEIDVSNYTAGDWVDFETSITATKTYQALLSNWGYEYTRGRGPASYSYDTDDFTVLRGIYSNDGDSSYSYRYNFDAVTTERIGGGSGDDGGDVGDSDYDEIDHFEHNDIWSYYDTNDSSGWQDTHEYAAYTGNYGLELNGFTHIFSGPWTDLPSYPEPGYVTRLNFRPKNLDSSNQYWFLFGGWGPDNCYRVEYIGEGTLRCRKVEDGTSDTLDGVYGSINWQDQWYQLSIYWHDSSRSGDDRDGWTVFLHEAGYDNWDDYLVNLDAGSNETTYKDEGIIGYRSSAGGAVYVDRVRRQWF